MDSRLLTRRQTLLATLATLAVGAACGPAGAAVDGDARRLRRGLALLRGNARLFGELRAGAAAKPAELLLTQAPAAGTPAARRPVSAP